MADGSIIIDTRIDTGGVSKGMNAVKAGMTRISAQVSKMGDSAKSSFQRQITAITDLYQNYEKQERKVSELKSKLEELSKVKIETEEYKKLKDDMKTLEDEFEKIEAKQREWLDMGFSIDSAPLKELDKQMDGIWADIDRLQRKQKEMQATGRAYVDPTYKSYMIFNAEFEFLLVAPLLFFKAIFSTEKINRFKMLLPLIFKS